MMMTMMTCGQNEAGLYSTALSQNGAFLEGNSEVTWRKFGYHRRWNYVDSLHRKLSNFVCETRGKSTPNLADFFPRPRLYRVAQNGTIFVRFNFNKHWPIFKTVLAYSSACTSDVITNVIGVGCFFETLYMKNFVTVRVGRKLSQRFIDHAIGQWRRRLECVVQYSGKANTLNI